MTTGRKTPTTKIRALRNLKGVTGNSAVNNIAKKKGKVRRKPKEKGETLLLVNKFDDQDWTW